MSTAETIYYTARAGQKITAIKDLRNHPNANLGLKEAKDVIDAAVVEPTEAQGIARIASVIGHGIQTKVHVKRGAEVKSWNGQTLAQFVVENGKFVVASGDGYDQIVFPADILDSVIEALKTLVA